MLVLMPFKPWLQSEVRVLRTTRAVVLAALALALALAP